MSISKVFLLSWLKYGENNAVASCYSYEYGYISLFIKNIYATRDKKKAYLFPLNELQIGFHKYTEGALLQVKRLELLQSFYTDASLHAGNVLMFGADFLYQVLKREIPNPQIYKAIQDFVKAVQQGDLEAHLSLILTMLKLQGFSPLLTEGKFLDPEQGQFTAEHTTAAFDEENSELWRKYLQNPTSIKGLKKKQRNRFLESLISYYGVHLAGFKIPESLKIMIEVYD